MKNMNSLSSPGHIENKSNSFQMGDVLGELHKAREVFIEKATEQARHMAWVIAVIYSKVQYLLSLGFLLAMGD